MNIFLTGAEGYAGKVLAPYLIQRGHRVVGLDAGFYREGELFHSPSAIQPPCIEMDLRQVTETYLEGWDAVVHLAELPDDSLGRDGAALACGINHMGSMMLAAMAKKTGVSRFIYLSSCSVYGAGSAEYQDERSEADPRTAYAKGKLLVERAISAMADDNFSPTFLRSASAYGPSPRMRFDLILNRLAGLAWTTKTIRIAKEDQLSYPLVHVRDIAHAIACALEAPQDIVHNQIFNVGATAENYRVEEVASIVAEASPGCRLTVEKSVGVGGLCRISFDKIHSSLPGFVCSSTARSGARELFEIFRSIGMTKEIFEFRAFNGLKQLDYLLRSGQIDEQFFWTTISQTPPSRHEPQDLRAKGISA